MHARAAAPRRNWGGWARWDRLFGTYRAQPIEGHEAMTIGIEQFRTRRDLWLDRLLLQPFHGKVGDYPINRRGSAQEK